MDKIAIFNELLQEGLTFTFENAVKRSEYDTTESFHRNYMTWKAKTEASLFKYVGRNNPATNYYLKVNLDKAIGYYRDIFLRHHGYIIAALESAIAIIEHDLLDTSQKVQPEIHLENIFSKFHSVCRQLRSRRAERPALEVEDEYDVQYLLHALLRLHFDDIRPEEWTPSYAGSSSRMDFLLKNEQTVIEVKKTRANLGPKELGEQLIIDIDKYKEHPNCGTLYCFVYDPEGRIPNTAGLENDLSRQRDNLKVIVKIYPK